MSALYSITFHLFYLLILSASLFNKKARLWITGRRNWRAKLKQMQLSGSPIFWFHAASLGEFEQGLPLMEELKRQLPGCSLVLTFYSPSGYEIRKNYHKADLVCYLPLDTRYNARNFIDLVKPDAVFFIKYEFWHFYLKQLHHDTISTFLISGIFRRNQAFFHWYGSWFRKKLRRFTHFFLQDVASSALLNSIGIQNTSITGDTRFDRVISTAASANNIEIAESFVRNKFCIVAGSTWPADEELLAKFINESGTDIKFIIAPHEIDKAHINRLTALFEKSYMLYSHSGINIMEDKQVLIIDNIGMLSSLYRYGQLAYIGGGFSKGIHNILEAAAFGIPVIFGPNHGKSREALEMIESGGAFTFSSQKELADTMDKLVKNADILLHASMMARDYIKNNTGATKTIAQTVLNMLQLQINKHSLNLD